MSVSIGDYNQNANSARCAAEYVVVPVDDFNARMARMAGTFNAVVSAHNIEHCDDPDLTLEVMMAALKPGGRLFLAFPTEASVRFPHRRGTLNFFDDPTPKTMPSFAVLCDRISSGVSASMLRYGAIGRWLRLGGGRNEIPSLLQGRGLFGTWV